MNINYKQPQFELFPANSATLEDINKPRFMLANLTLSIESLVIMTILGIMVALFSFSIGVERGKGIAAQALDERVSTAWNVGARTVAPPVAVNTAVKPVVMQMRVGHMMPMYKPATIHETVLANRYTLQAATYGNEGYAKQDAMVLKAKGLQPFLIKSGNYWLLCVGNFNSKEGALVLLRRLPIQFRASQVRRF